MKLADRAVSATFLRAFLHQHPEAAGLSTAAVVESIVKPATASRRCAYAELEGPVAQTDAPSVGPITHFISHAWSGNFGELVDIIVDCDGDGTDGHRFFWLDIFAISQHAGAEQAGELAQLCSVLLQARETVAVLTPWRAPIAVSRVWCLYEYMTAVSGKGPASLKVRLSKEQQRDFIAQLVERFEEVDKLISRLDVRRAEATKADDRDMIQARVRETTGFVLLNETVQLALKRWLRESAEAALEELLREHGPDDGRVLKLQDRLGMLLRAQESDGAAMLQALHHCQCVLDARRRQDAAAAQQAAAPAQDAVAAAQEDAAAQEAAEGAQEEAVVAQEEAAAAQKEEAAAATPDAAGAQLGAAPEAAGAPDAPGAAAGQADASAPDAAAAAQSEAVVDDAAGQDDASTQGTAAAQGTAAVQGAAGAQGGRALGPSLATLQSMQSVGMILRALGRRGEALPLLQEALEGMTAALGPADRQTLRCLNDVGYTLVASNEPLRAEQLFRQGLDLIQQATAAAPDKQQSLQDVRCSLLSNLGKALQLSGRLEDSLAVLDQSWQLKKEQYGEKHPSTVMTAADTTSVLRLLGRLAEAVPLLQELLQVCIEVLGKQHRHTCMLHSNLAVMRGQQGAAAEAEEGFRTALSGFLQCRGAAHSSTHTVAHNHALLLCRRGDHAGALRLLRQHLLPPDSPAPDGGGGAAAAAGGGPGAAAEAEASGEWALVVAGLRGGEAAWEGGAEAATFGALERHLLASSAANIIVDTL